MLNAAKGVRHLPYFKFPSLPAEGEMESIGFPLVAKPVNGACGRGLFKLNSYQELSAWVRQNERYLDDYYVQPYIPKLNNEDYIIIVVNQLVEWGLRVTSQYDGFVFVMCHDLLTFKLVGYG